MNNKTLKEIDSWRDAVCFLVDEKTNNNKCFSSGEISKEIREKRQDIVFSVYDVGQYLRDLYYSDCITYNNVQACQVPRMTVGAGRTPADVEVFVYSATSEDGFDYDFEVDIPLPDKALGDATNYKEYGTVQGEAELRKDSQSDPVATVHSDGRLCIPRKAFDAFMYASGKAINPGDKVHIQLDQSNERIVVSLYSCTGTRSYDLTRDRGRVKYMPDDSLGWNSGDKYSISVSSNQLIVDLKQPI